MWSSTPVCARCAAHGRFIDDLWNGHVDALQRPNCAVPNTGSFLKNNQLAAMYYIPGMAIGSKLLSEQPGRDRAEHGALRKAVRLKSVLVSVNTEQLHIYNYYFTSEVSKLWYASVWLLHATRAAFNGTFEEEIKGIPYIHSRFNAQYQSLINGEIYFFKQ